MIDLSSYRQRIGSFYQVIGNSKNFLQNSTEKAFNNDIFSSILIVSAYLLFLCIYPLTVQYGYSLESKIVICSATTFDNLSSLEDHYLIIWTNFSGNFYARYFNGNGRDSGIRVYHLNIRSLQNKV